LISGRNKEYQINLALKMVGKPKKKKVLLPTRTVLLNLKKKNLNNKKAFWEYRKLHLLDLLNLV